MNTDTSEPEDPKLGFGRFLLDTWGLAKPYFTSEEKWTAWFLFLSVIGLNLLNVGLTVILNYWRQEFYNALQNYDVGAFLGLIFWWAPVKEPHLGMNFQLGFLPVALVFVFVAVYALNLTMALQIRARTWTTKRFVNDWTSDLAYYRIGLTHAQGEIGTDNPDQRIAEDIRDFWDKTLSIVVDFISTVCTFGSFIGILWFESGPFTVPEAIPFVGGYVVQNYLVWVALIYAVLGTWVTHVVGRRLAKVRFIQQAVEAFFRFGLVRFRENAEGIALYRGETDERKNLDKQFDAVVSNYRELMSRLKRLSALTTTYAQLAVVFPYCMAAPRYFAKQIPLGELMQIAGAFDQVQSSLSWIVSSYSSLAQWQSIVVRLSTFQRAIGVARSPQGITVINTSEQDVKVRGLTLELPNGVKLLSDTDLTFEAGTSVVVTGASGSGKSTLFRAIAGIWPYGHGSVTRRVDSCLFLPQKAYIPLGTLRRVVSFPQTVEAYTDAEVSQALVDAGLPNLVVDLDKDDKWPTRLSGGEQQRVALARALLFKPDWLFLDEATSSLDPDSEQHLYRTIKERLPKTTIVSIAHRETVAAFHNERLIMQRGQDGAPGQLVRTTINGGLN